MSIFPSVFDIFNKLPGGVTSFHKNKFYVNLQQTIKNQLLSSGCAKKDITLSNICTYCNSDLLFSHRKTEGKRGSLAAIMELI